MAHTIVVCGTCKGELTRPSVDRIGCIKCNWSEEQTTRRRAEEIVAGIFSRIALEIPSDIFAELADAIEAFALRGRAEAVKEERELHAEISAAFDRLADAVDTRVLHKPIDVTEALKAWAAIRARATPSGGRG